MARRKRPSVTDYLADLDQPAAPTSNRDRGDEVEERAPVSGTCKGCSCPLGFQASLCEGKWYCCGACSGSNRCTCGCKPEHARPTFSDDYVTLRRMFAARRSDELNSRAGDRADRLRAFPFTDAKRGR